MARDFNGTTMYLENANAILSAYPLTMVGWFNSDSATGNQDILSIADGGGTHYFALNAGGNAVGDPVRANVVGGGGTSVAQTTTGYTVGQWHHAAGVFASATSRAAFIDGGSKGTSAANNTPAGLTRTSIGHKAVSARTAFFDGRIAEVALWNVALTDAEVAALARGVAPPFIRFDALVGYWPVWGLHDPEIDLTVNNRQMTLTASPAAASHAPVAPFSARPWGTHLLIEAAGGGFQAAWARGSNRLISGGVWGG